MYDYRPKPRPKRRSFIVVLLWLVAGYILVTQVGRFFLQQSTKAVSPLGENSANSTIYSLKEIQTQSPQGKLTRVVQGALSGAHGSYGIVIKHLSTGEEYTLNQHRSYQSGSLYKLWVMATVYERIAEGALRESDTLTQDIALLNEKFGIAPEEAEETEGSVSFTTDEALYEMITISDNYAALLLTEAVGLSRVASFLNKYGFVESTVGTSGGAPTVTPYDTALFLEKLYNDELGTKGATNKMLTLLKAQRLISKLPKYLPEGVAIAHKTGELGSFSHDAGIVYTPQGEYIIVVLSRSDDPQSANERIAFMSEAVYEYFTNR